MTAHCSCIVAFFLHNIKIGITAEKLPWHHSRRQLDESYWRQGRFAVQSTPTAHFL